MLRMKRSAKLTSIGGGGLTPLSPERRETLFASSRNTERKSKLRISGAARVTAVPLFLFCLALTIVGSMSIPVEHASVQNGIKTTGKLYLPHVKESLDAYEWVVWPDGDRTHEMRVRFCRDAGLPPPFDEGQWLAWIKYRPTDSCLQLLSAQALERDSHGDVITHKENP